MDEKNSRTKPHRHTHNRVAVVSPWVYGHHAVRAILLNPNRRIERLVATEANQTEVAQWLKNSPHAIQFEPIDKERLAALLPMGAVHQGVAVLAKPLAELALEDFLNSIGERTVILMLDQVSDPHNLGAILRSAAVFGAAAVVLTERAAPPLSGVVAKAASGAIERVAVVRVVNLARALDQVYAAGFWRIGLDSAAPTDLAAVIGGKQPIAKLALLLGAEGDGLRRLTREHCDAMARLSATSDFTSLNVSNAAAVALFVAQQRFGTT